MADLHFGDKDFVGGENAGARERCGKRHDPEPQLLALIGFPVQLRMRHRPLEQQHERHHERESRSAQRRIFSSLPMIHRPGRSLPTGRSYRMLQNSPQKGHISALKAQNLKASIIFMSRALYHKESAELLTFCKKGGYFSWLAAAFAFCRVCSRLCAQCFSLHWRPRRRGTSTAAMSSTAPPTHSRIAATGVLSMEILM